MCPHLVENVTVICSQMVEKAEFLKKETQTQIITLHF